tara:strand:- start:539 stop:748 length:210 start_codon:yes stop_codon:yes gene_type:complete
MIEPFSESNVLEVIQEIINTETLEHLSVDDQMMILNLISDAIRRYKAKEVEKFLNEMDNHYTNKKLSDL